MSSSRLDQARILKFQSQLATGAKAVGVKLIVSAESGNVRDDDADGVRVKTDGFRKKYGGRNKASLRGILYRRKA